MENPSDIVKIEKHLVDRKRFKKQFRKKFQMFEASFLLTKYPEDLIKYREHTKQIMKFISDALLRDKTYDVGNIYFLIGIMNDHMSFLGDCAKRMADTYPEMRPSLLQVLHEKNLKLIEILKSNETHPVTISELEKKYAGDIVADATGATIQQDS